MADRKSGLVREAGWHSSLRVRLALAIAVSVAITGVGAGYLALRIGKQALTDDVRNIAVRAAERAVDELELLSDPLKTDIANTVLSEINASIPEIEAVSLIVRKDNAPLLIATTGVPPGEAGHALVRRSLREEQLVVQEDADVIRVAAPVSRQGAPTAAVLVRVDLGSVIGLQQRASRALLGFALLTVVALVVLVDLLAWPLVYRPIQHLGETMARVSAGDLTARAPVARRDELGEVGEGLNEMLEQLENFNDALQARVREATQELQARNEQLVDSYNRVFGLREQLASAEQLAAVGQTAANVAHQVGTPLNLISGYVQMLKEEIGPQSPLNSRLMIIEEQVQKVTATVRTLLDRSRQIGRKTRTTAGELVARVCEAMRPNLDAAGIRLTLDDPAGTTPILVDATNLELALLNLMTNAVDAMPGGGTLTVRLLAPLPGTVQIEISDTGHGIPRDLLPRIFEAWVSTKMPGRGTGLGLAIARDVISAHGGTISVASEVGQGTTFTIELPADVGREVASSVS